MSEHHPNVVWINNWIDRLMKKHGICGCASVEGLAKFMEEEGNENPSNEAIQTAKEWEANPEKIRLCCRYCIKCDGFRKFKQVGELKPTQE